LEESTQSWLTDFFASMSLGDAGGYADRDAIFRKVARTVRALAQMGEKVIVGSGGVLLTQKLPGGIHVRLVASHNYRVMRLAEQLHIDVSDAARRIEQLDRIRNAFFKRYWPGETLRPELFTLTINTERVDTETAAELVVKLVKYVEQT
jgi:cytidylate kinase